MRMPLSGSRTEFLSSEALGEPSIQYGRSGGCFVSTRRALLLAAAVAAAIITVALLVYYLAPPPPGGTSRSTVPDSGAQIPPPAPQQLRLPSDVRPSAYDIWLQPFIGQDSNFTFKGRVEVELKCVVKGGCASICLHSKDLSLDWSGVRLRKLAPGASILHPNASTPEADIINVRGHEVSTEKETVTLLLERHLAVGGNYSLRIPFWGNVSTGLSGLYRSNFTDKSGVNRWLAVTHLEATSARKVFPCFDEPALKAQFALHVARRAPHNSLSNMPLERSEPIEGQSGWTWDHFLPTPVMSSYLVAVVVSELAEQRAPPKPGQPAFSVAARPELLPTAAYALKVGPSILEHYANYFNVAYPLPKMTMAAVPDFAAGAMENWGLVLYRESLMLYDPKTSTELSLYSVASVVAHELAHQWFGNIVTMAWWTDLWLNEGFATYVSYIGVNHVEPTWNTFEKIVIRELHPVLETDSLNSTHPVSVEVNNPSQISEVFDEVSYNKGASLIRMLNHSLTEKVFRAGVTNYLNKWVWGNAKQDDLWAALTAATTNEGPLLPPGHSVKDVMDTWTLQEGYPLVTATRDYQQGTVTFTQRPFSLHMRATASDVTDAANTTDASGTERRVWFVPLSMASGDDPSRLRSTSPRMWLTPAVPQLTFKPALPADQWLLVNVEETGFFRVNYDATNWRLLGALLNSDAGDAVPPVSKAQLLNDAFSLARAGQLPYATPLDLALYLRRERSPTPWLAFLSNLAFLDDMLRDTSHYPQLQELTRRMLRPLVDSLGGEQLMEEGQQMTQPRRHLRAAALARLLHAEEPRMQRWADAQFNAWLNASTDNNPVPVDLRAAVYCSATQRGGEREWQALKARLGAADAAPSERAALLYALACTRVPHLIVTALEMSLEEGGGVRLQDFIHVWRAAPKNPVAAAIAFRYLRGSWERIHSKYSKISFVLKNVIKSAIAGLSTEADLQDVRAWVSARGADLTPLVRTVTQAQEKLALRVRWRRERQAAVARWLQQSQHEIQQPGSSSKSTTSSFGTTSAALSTGSSGSTGNTGSTSSSGSSSSVATTPSSSAIPSATSATVTPA